MEENYSDIHVEVMGNKLRKIYKRDLWGKRICGKLYKEKKK